MNVEKKKSRVTVAVLMVFIMACVALTVSSSNVFAKSRPFFFRVSYNQENGQEADGWRRGNVPASNRWSVLLTRSGKGKGSLTDFWLEAEDAINVSPYIRVRCGGGWYSQTAYKSAKGRKVYLTAEDNNDKPAGYNVRGRWKVRE